MASLSASKCLEWPLMAASLSVSDRLSNCVPHQVLKELSKLQNEVPGFPAKRALKIIKNELGLDVNELFQSFDPQPLAAASLAQVRHNP